MKRLLTAILVLSMAVMAHAQADVVTIADAITIFKSGKQATAKSTLESKGYKYKGISTLSGKEYCWTKNITLSADFLPVSYGRGNSSVFFLSTDGKTVSLYVYNHRAFSGLQSQVRKLGYTVTKEKNGTLICTADGKPTISFMQFQMPYPFCVMITE